jgi:hypothetical protein
MQLVVSDGLITKEKIMNKSEKVQKAAHDALLASITTLMERANKNKKLKRSDKNVRLENIRSK